jgi:hypothetical protein
MGGWLGRVAARYRMSVGELAERYQLSIPVDSSGAGWLLLAPMDGGLLTNVAALARLDTATLEGLQIPAQWNTRRTHLPYCPTCLFLNPVDVTAPRWMRQWLDPEAKDCVVHELPLIDVPIGVVRQCRNFDYVLRMASRQERHREMLARNLRDLVAGGYCVLANRISRRR